jgi:type I restriction enzyme R subunit
MKFTESQLEAAFTELLAQQDYPHTLGASMVRSPEDVLIRQDLKDFLLDRYHSNALTAAEADRLIRELERHPASDLYASNKAISSMVRDGVILRRDDHQKKDLYIQFIDYRDLGETLAPDPSTLPLVASDRQAPYNAPRNIYRFVTQMEIQGYENKSIPDGILYINGIPLVVFEFKSAIREEATLHTAFLQITNRYRRNIPELLKYNAFCVISDGVNNKAGSLFAPYEFFYGWRRTEGMENEADGIESLYTMIEGMFDPVRLRDIIHNFIHFPDSKKDARKETKILCRYPQYYAARKLYRSILLHQKPEGDGKGGTYFGATGSGKSLTMLFLCRLLMKSVELGSPTIVLITDRTDLDDQLSEDFLKAKKFLGDDHVMSVESRDDLRKQLEGLNSGGVFLSTIHKFTEDTQLLTKRENVICISDEAHRSQTNLEQKVRVTEKGVRKTYGFAKYLHDSLPNATYVGFTGTPVDATLDVFGPVVDAYTMTESVEDEITVRIVYEGRAAKVLLDDTRLQEIEAYYQKCAEDGANEHQIEESKKSMANMRAIIGAPERLKAVAADFVEHYEKRVSEGATLMGKVMFVCSARTIAYELYKEITALRPEWAEVKVADEGVVLTEREKKEIKAIERIKMVMTRGKDDDRELYELLGNKAHRKELDRQFKFAKSNFKLALVVDMWLTGFDVPFLDTMYIDKPIQRHNLIQTISRVNRKFERKEKGLIVDYIGIRRQMNLALKEFNDPDKNNFEDIQQSIVVVRDHLDLLGRIFHKFDSQPYFEGSPLEQLHTLNLAAEFVQVTQELEKRFMYLVKRMKAAYDICAGSGAFEQEEQDRIHFYFAVRSIVFKLTKGDAPDTAQMNARVQKLIMDALHSQGIEEILKLGEDDTTEIDIFDADYLAKIDKIKLPNTKLKLLQKLLAKAIGDFKKVNRLKGIDFSQKFRSLVQLYNERKEDDVFEGNVHDEATEQFMRLFEAMITEMKSFEEMDIGFEEKAFYDILKELMRKYDFAYPEDKLIHLAKEVKIVVDDKAKYTDWSKRDDIKSELKADLIILLAENGYPPVDRDEVYKEIFEQAENFKKYGK